MRKRMRYVGFDVHAETIAVAVAEPHGSVRELGTKSDIRVASRAGGPDGWLSLLRQSQPRMTHRQLDRQSFEPANGESARRWTVGAV